MTPAIAQHLRIAQLRDTFDFVPVSGKRPLLGAHDVDDARCDDGAAFEIPRQDRGHRARWCGVGHDAQYENEQYRGEFHREKMPYLAPGCYEYLRRARFVRPDGWVGTMGQHTLYAYVDGADLDGVAEQLDSLLTQFVDAHPWRFNAPWVINQRHERDSTHGPGDLPDWDLGLNLELPDPDHEPPGWFADVEHLARFLVDLRGRTGRDFVIGIADASRGITEDLYFIDARGLDLESLRRVIGVREDVP